MSTTQQHIEVGLTAKDVNKVSETMLNLARDSDDAILGSGYRHPFPEMAEAIQRADEERKKEKEKKHKQLMDHLQAELAALQNQLAGLENNLGGLPEMGKNLGLSQNPSESDDDFRKRIRDEIQVQIIAGTLNDPTGEYKQWAATYDQIEDRKSLLSLEASQFSNHVNSQSGMIIRMKELEDGSILTMRKLDQDDPRVIEAMREAIRQDIQEKLDNGTLDDPEGNLQEWASVYDEREVQKQKLIDISDSLVIDAHLTVDETMGEASISASNSAIDLRQELGEDIKSNHSGSNQSLDAGMADFLFASAEDLEVGEQFNTAASGQDIPQQIALETEANQDHSPKLLI